MYIRCIPASIGLWLAHVRFLKIVSMQESVCVHVHPEATVNRERSAWLKFHMVFKGTAKFFCEYLFYTSFI